jgi:hypothetical protein
VLAATFYPGLYFVLTFVLQGAHTNLDDQNISLLVSRAYAMNAIHIFTLARSHGRPTEANLQKSSDRGVVLRN